MSTGQYGRALCGALPSRDVIGGVAGSHRQSKWPTNPLNLPQDLNSRRTTVPHQTTLFSRSEAGVLAEIHKLKLLNLDQSAVSTTKEGKEGRVSEDRGTPAMGKRLGNSRQQPDQAQGFSPFSPRHFSPRSASESPVTGETVFTTDPRQWCFAQLEYWVKHIDRDIAPDA
ncbi:hypothetical protein DFH94DRAFT_687216 [Russula ochroleuca]|uniref:Uncharacterized protein n=1 Tax=Russula ochroleuca TaxID=152965 RepID=A0A9P5JU40_9AGAM|nr:hypothetical protein DFH94DRAFT_687216 [Russula ochroleuca]